MKKARRRTPERIVGRFAEEFQKLMMLVLMEPWELLREPELIEAHYAAHWALR